MGGQDVEFLPFPACFHTTFQITATCAQDCWKQALIYLAVNLGLLPARSFTPKNCLFGVSRISYFTLISYNALTKLK